MVRGAAKTSVAILGATLLALCGCEQRGTPAAAPAAAQSPGVSPADATSGDAVAAADDTPFFVGRWAAAETACGHEAWIFTKDGLATPGEVSCSFDRTTRVAAGYAITATCTAEGPPAPAQLHLAYAESAKALLVEGGPFADVGLIACPSPGN
jgi:hypothetical protein